MAAQATVIRAAVGFLYPAYKSLHAIMADDRGESLLWMRYWVVLAVFSLLETVGYSSETIHQPTWPTIRADQLFCRWRILCLISSQDIYWASACF